MFCSLCSDTEETEDYHQIFGSSGDSDSDFEKFIASRKKKKARTKRVTSDLTVDEIKGRTRKPKARRPPKKKPKAKADDVWEEDTTGLYRDKENLIEMEEDRIEEVVVKPVPLKPKFKRRVAGAERSIVEGFLTEGLDKEDVQMFKQALSRLKEGEDPVSRGVAWAHYPHYIL